MKIAFIAAVLIFAILFLAALLVYLVNRKRWRLWRIIQAGDPQQVEAARDWVTPKLVPYLMKKYWQASDWAKKRSIVKLLQDQFHPDLPKLMLDFLRVPLKAGNDPNEAGGSGHTPLMVAAENNFYALVELLIQRGANVNAVHTGPGIYVAMKGWTPLVFSVNAGLVRMTKLLIVAGADPRHRVPDGKRWDGESLPGRGLLDFAGGKRAESIKKAAQESWG